MVSTYSYAPASKSCRARPLMRSGELFRQHRINNRLDIRWMWASGAGIDLGLSYTLIGRMTCLQYVQSTAHISLGQLKQSRFPIISEVDTALRGQQVT